ncbi:MAG: hypothetical protein HY698_15645 [Deltaproteobacteria bacterium]|nr:hypothetical protein [Deltaproteobacteria bacterium]
MNDDPAMDVSVIVPFGDDEDRVGKLVVRVAEHLRPQVRRFEILAVAEDSGDNSIAVLSLLRAQVPEIELLCTEKGHGFATGAKVARGRALWLLDVARSDAPLFPFHWASRKIHSDAADLVVLEGRYVLCRRTRTWRALEGIRGRGTTFERRLVRRAAVRGLRIERLPR